MCVLILGESPMHMRYDESEKMKKKKLIIIEKTADEP